MDVKLLQDIAEAVKAISTPKTSAYDTPAKVTRVEDGVAWVHIDGGVDETPVKLTIAAQPGDTVQVRVGGGRAWLTGNGTAPPTDDRVANAAQKTAQEAQETANTAVQDAEIAHLAAESAQHSADVAAEAADDAQKSADNIRYPRFSIGIFLISYHGTSVVFVSVSNVRFSFSVRISFSVIPASNKYFVAADSKSLCTNSSYVFTPVTWYSIAYRLLLRTASYLSGSVSLSIP